MVGDGVNVGTAVSVGMTTGVLVAGTTGVDMQTPGVGTQLPGIVAPPEKVAGKPLIRPNR